MGIASFLDQTCAIERQTIALDATRANVPTWTPRLSGVACTLQPYRHGSEQFAFQRDDTMSYYVMYTAADIAASTQDRVNVGGTYYAVVGYLYVQNTRMSIGGYGAALVGLRNQ